MKQITPLGEISEERYKDEIVASIIGAIKDHDLNDGCFIHDTLDTISYYKGEYKFRSSKSNKSYKLESLSINKLKKIYSDIVFAKVIE